MANGDMLIALTAWRRLSNKEDQPPAAFADYVDAAIEMMVARFGDAPTPVPACWKLAAFEVCKQLWTADGSGDGRPSGGDPVQRGFAWPARALEVMAAYDLGGFA